ncbi:MAG: DNA double-strand break repair nuclease NurA [Desulfurococcales archaeon]|nr:DNA double-strand break repair nuclease NurA [Desulfurococcales archaeon]
MSVHALSRLLRRTVEAIATASAGAPRLVQSPLRLSDLVELRAPLEDLGPDTVRVHEQTPHLLSPRSPAPSRRSPLSRGETVIAGVDSGSRALETPPAGIAVAAVAATLTAPLARAGLRVEAILWPPIPPAPTAPLAGPPFIRVLPNWEGPEPELPEFAASTNPAGARYGPEYSMAQALDEARVTLENWALRSLAAAVESAPPGEGRLAVLVDGPVLLVPGALERPGSPPAYREAWERLLSERLAAVERLEALGVPVIGVVKRVSRSRLLSRARGLEGRLEACLGPLEASDEALIHRAYAACARRAPGRIYRSPILEVRSAAGSKLAEYLVVPRGKWQVGPGSVVIVRLEYTPGSLELVREHLRAEPYHVYARASVLAGSVQPLVIAASDRRARTAARAVARSLARELAVAGVPLSYESEVEARIEALRGGGGWRGWLEA